MTAPVLLDVAAIARAIRRPYSTVYRWGQVGAIKRHGKDTAGRWLYDLAEAIEVSERARATMTRSIRSCAVPKRNGDDCNEPGMEDMPFPICTRHAIEVHEAVTAARDAAPVLATRGEPRL